jgi:glycosyltransferase involved in cell wall biosynthesis
MSFGSGFREPLKKVAFCTPTITRPHDAFWEALEASCGPLTSAGYDHHAVFEVGSAYISHARATMLRKALDIQPDIVVFIDHDMSWRPQDLLKLLETPGDVVAGTYRFKQDKEEYMGTWRTDDAGYPVTREDGCIHAEWVPAGFLKVTDQAIHDFMGAYPELVYGSRYRPHVDLFNHGAWNGVWYGEDYAFSRRWNDRGGDIWIVPDLELTHHGFDGSTYPGNLHTYLRHRPGGDLAEAA